MEYDILAINKLLENDNKDIKLIGQKLWYHSINKTELNIDEINDVLHNIEGVNEVNGI